MSVLQARIAHSVVALVAGLAAAVLAGVFYLETGSLMRGKEADVGFSLAGASSG